MAPLILTLHQMARCTGLMDTMRYLLRMDDAVLSVMVQKFFLLDLACLMVLCVTCSVTRSKAMIGLLKMKDVLGTKAWLIYLAGLSLFVVFCLAVMGLALTLI